MDLKRLFEGFYPFLSLSNYFFCYKIDAWLYCQTGVTNIF
ncbi:hypothetical protein HPNQ4216_1452 [Helicobacter pylori NQ4216]|nr:hypothetical protein HPNQ4216_1452 [Helicobacter pylori NQ4216]